MQNSESKNIPSRRERGASSGTLWLVATPIGNLADFSARARDTLIESEHVYAEDTRCTARLLSKLGLRKPMRSLHEHNEQARIPEILQALEAGDDVAVVSDAGTPLISDPGFRVTRAVHEAGFRVAPVPGASAVTAALSVAGLPTDRFLFVGFLPARVAARKKALQSLVDLPWTLVFYESTHRIRACIKDLADCFGGRREICICRELTKRFETVRLTTLDRATQYLAEDSDQSRGEFVLVVHGADPGTSTCSDRETRRVLEILRAELAPSQAVKLAAKITGVSRRALYSRDSDP